MPSLLNAKHCLINLGIAKKSHLWNLQKYLVIISKQETSSTSPCACILHCLEPTRLTYLYGRYKYYYTIIILLYFNLHLLKIQYRLLVPKDKWMQCWPQRDKGVMYVALLNILKWWKNFFLIMLNTGWKWWQQLCKSALCYLVYVLRWVPWFVVNSLSLALADLTKSAATIIGV